MAKAQRMHVLLDLVTTSPEIALKLDIRSMVHIGQWPLRGCPKHDLGEIGAEKYAENE